MNKSVSSVFVVGVFTDGFFKILDTLSHTDDLLFEGGLFRLKVSQLLVEADGLSLHGAVMAVDLFLNAVKLICKSLACILALHGEDVLKGLLLATQDLHLLLVRDQVLIELSASLRQVCKLSLEVSSVFRSLHLTDSCVT